MVITKCEFQILKNAQEGKTFCLKVDFGQRVLKAKRVGDKAYLDNEASIDLTQKVKDKFCYLLDNQRLREIAFFDEGTNRYYKLIPTTDWPTIAIGSVPMHKLSSPKKDTENKIGLIKPYGFVLDTCMGLGYTAILASKEAEKIITFEKDENVFIIAQRNPLSQRLFEAKNIEIRREDVFEGIKNLKSYYFDCIIHDPPTLRLAGELFSGDFYHQAFRVLKEKGRLFHYTPLYKVKSGFDFPAKIKKNLQRQGFKKVEYYEKAGGLICQK